VNYHFRNSVIFVNHFLFVTVRLKGFLLRKVIQETNNKYCELDPLHDNFTRAARAGPRS
jgi:hypothetical protein